MRTTVAITPLSDVGHWIRGNGLEIALIVVGAVLVARLVRVTSNWLTHRIDAHGTDSDELVRTEAAKHRHALAQVLSWTMLVLIYSAAAILVIERLGLPVTGFVAPATVVGVALGFGAQGIVQDLLAGFFLIAERQYGFGDLIRVSVIGVPAPIVGTVEEVTLRITTIRTTNGEVVITPNGRLVQVTNLSRDWARAVLDVPVPASADVAKVSDVLKQIGEAAYVDEALHPLLLDAPTVMGVESIEVDEFKIRMVARTLPGKQFEVGRALRARIAHRFLQEGINVRAGLEASQPSGTS